jgi:(S)-2-hydroxyglutarate dehydrogenase
VKKFDYVVIGAGIVGLVISYEILKNNPNKTLIILEKSSKLGDGQTGNNSGVIHSGIYYKTGSLKSKLCLEGHNLLVSYLENKEISFQNNGKFIISNSKAESNELNKLEKNAEKSGISCLRLSKSDLNTIDSEIIGEDALFVKSAKTVNYLEVINSIKGEVINLGGKILFNSFVEKIDNNEIKIKSNNGIICNDKIIVAAGIGVDNIVKSKNYFTIGFKGRYLKSRRFRKGNALVYPAPNPKLPFLGVHTCMQSEKYEYFGPNAVFSFSKTPIILNNVFNNYFFKIGFYKLLLKNWKTGLKEILLTNSDYFFKKELKKIIQIKKISLQKGFFGVRAQCVSFDGNLVDDFVIEENHKVIVLRNVPSPAATSSFAIAKHVLQNFEI